MLTMFRGSPSLTRKYGAAALTSLKGAVLWRAMIVSHCLSVILGFLSIPAIWTSSRSQHAYLVDNAVPSKAGIVDDDVNLAIAKLRSFLDKGIDISAVQHIARYGGCDAPRLVDLVGYFFCLF